MGVEHRQETAEEEGVGGQRPSQRGDDLFSSAPVAVLAGEQGELQQRLGRHRVAGRDGVVVEILGSEEETFVVGAGGVEDAAAGIAEALQHEVEDLGRGLVPAGVEIRLVELEQSVGQGGVVLQVTV